MLLAKTMCWMKDIVTGPTNVGQMLMEKCAELRTAKRAWCCQNICVSLKELFGFALISRFQGSLPFEMQVLTERLLSLEEKKCWKFHWGMNWQWIVLTCRRPAFCDIHWMYSCIQKISIHICTFCWTNMEYRDCMRSVGGAESLDIVSKRAGEFNDMVRDKMKAFE